MRKLFIALAGIMLSIPMACTAGNTKPIFYLTPSEIFQDQGLRELAEAAQHGNVKKINRLISKGVRVNGHGKYGMGPLFSAWQARNKIGYKTLLDRDADPNNIWTNGYTLLNAIAMTSDPYFMKLALEHGANPNLVAPATNETPIFRAVSPGGKVNLELLIKAGANIDHQSSNGVTPMIEAAFANQYDAVYQLLKDGANYRLRDTLGSGHDIRYYVMKAEKYMDKSGSGGVWLGKVVNFLKERNFLPPEMSSGSSSDMATVAESSPQIVNYEVQGNLQSTRKIGCIAGEELSDRDTPADLYPALVKCLHQDQYQRAVIIYALAGVYTKFDTLRVVDKTAHDVHAVFIHQLGNAVTQEKLKNLADRVKATAGDAGKLFALCVQIRKIGPPDYYPRYMIQHGMQAFTGLKTPNGLVSEFDAKKAWAKSLASYMHCPDANGTGP